MLLVESLCVPYGSKHRWLSNILKVFLLKIMYLTNDKDRR